MPAGEDTATSYAENHLDAQVMLLKDLKEKTGLYSRIMIITVKFGQCRT
jgi:hypothetical protein